MIKHILLIGFKSAGKTAIGRELGRQLGVSFFDLDEEVEKLFENQQGKKLTCRQIMLKIGQNSFRQLEHEALKMVLEKPKQAVVSLGGGTPTFEANRRLILFHQVVYVKAPKSLVYERIMLNGRPAFFPDDEDSATSFNRIWKERSHIYGQLTKIKVENSGTVGNAVAKIKKIINQTV